MSSVISDTWLLLVLRWQISWNSFKSRKPVVKVFSIVGAIMLGGLFGITSAGVGAGIGLLLKNFPEGHLEPVLPGVILTGVALLLLISSFGTALGSLFLASDLDLLMTAPVDRKAVFISKILDSMAFNYMLVVVAALPALIAYGLGLGYGPAYYLLVVLAVLGTPLLPAALGAVLVMLVARFAPARRVREVLGLFGALFGLGCGVLGQTSRFWFRDIEGTATSGSAIVSWLQGIAALPIPTFMAGRGLASAGTGDFAGAAGNLVLFFAATFGVFGLCVLLADNLYASGWVRMQSSGNSKRSKERAERAASRSGWLGRVSADFAIALKDWRVIPRDLRNFSQLLAPLVFLPIFYFNFVAGFDGGSRLGGRGTPLPGLGQGSFGDLIGVFSAGGILFTTIMIFGRISTTSISMEGKSWWVMKLAPVSGAELLRGKLLSSSIPYMIVSTLLLVGVGLWRHFNLAWLAYGWFAMEVLGIGMLAVGVGLAVPWAKLDWDDPRRMSSGWGSLISMLSWVLIGLVGGFLFCMPVLSEAFAPSLELYAFLAGILLGTAMCAIVGWAVIQFGVAKLPDVGE